MEKVEEVEKVEEGNKMKKIGILSVAVLAYGAAFGAEICDLSMNVESRDGHTPPDPARYFVVCASKRYEAHPTSVMLPDDRTILAFWDIQGGGPCGSAAISTDAGRTWTRIDERIPAAFAECHDEPKAYRFVDPKTGKARIRVFASYGTATWRSWRGPAERPLDVAMPSILSEDDGKTWKYMPPLGTNFACVVCFTGMVRLDDGSYLGVFSRGSQPNGEGGPYRVMGSVSRDGGLTWETPFEIIAGKGGTSVFEPTVFRSPDGKELCVLGCNWGAHGEPATACFSKDGGKTWTQPKRVEGLSGFGHSVGRVPDGRLIIAFRRGNKVFGWLGDYAEIKRGKGVGGGIKVSHSYGEQFDCGAPCVHVRKDGEVIALAASQNNFQHPMPTVFALHFTAGEVDREIKIRTEAQRNFMGWEPFKGTSFKPLRAGKFYGPFAQEMLIRDKLMRTIAPYDGSVGYRRKVAGDTFVEMENDKGTYAAEKFFKHRTGNAAIASWTVEVKEDCTARLRLIGSPMTRCCLGTRCVLPAVGSTIFDQRTAEINLKKGENEISLMVWDPQDVDSCKAGWSGLPMRFALGLECKGGFKCLHPGRNLEMKEEVDIDDVLEEGL